MLLPASHLFDYPCSAPVASTCSHQTKQPLKRHVLFYVGFFRKQHRTTRTSSGHNIIEVSSLTIIEHGFHGFPKANEIRTTATRRYRSCRASNSASILSRNLALLRLREGGYQATGRNWTELRTEVQRVVQ